MIPNIHPSPMWTRRQCKSNPTVNPSIMPLSLTNLLLTRKSVLDIWSLWWNAKLYAWLVSSQQSIVRNTPGILYLLCELSYISYLGRGQFIQKLLGKHPVIAFKISGVAYCTTQPTHNRCRGEPGRVFSYMTGISESGTTRFLSRLKAKAWRSGFWGDDAWR